VQSLEPEDHGKFSAREAARSAARMSAALGAGSHERKLEGLAPPKTNTNKIRNCFFSLKGPFTQIQLCPKKQIVTFGHQGVALAGTARGD
jgi:hypothetical protein